MYRDDDPPDDLDCDTACPVCGVETPDDGEGPTCGDPACVAQYADRVEEERKAESAFAEYLAWVATLPGDRMPHRL